MKSQHDADLPQADQYSAQNEPAPAPPAPPSTPTETPPGSPREVPQEAPQEVPQPDPAPDPGQAPTPQARRDFFYLRVRQRRQPNITRFRLTRIPPPR